jgi:hypothetical protein
MKPTVAIVASILAVLAAFMLVQYKQKERFDAAGLVFNKPPEWFHKAAYNPNDWIVSYNPDQLALPGGCDMHYRGDPRELNYLSSSYRFWRDVPFFYNGPSSF